MCAMSMEGEIEDEKDRGVGQKERLWIFNENCKGNKA